METGMTDRSFDVTLVFLLISPQLLIPLISIHHVKTVATTYGTMYGVIVSFMERLT